MKLFKNGILIGKVTSTDERYIYAIVKGKTVKISRWGVCYIDCGYHTTIDCVEL